MKLPVSITKTAAAYDRPERVVERTSEQASERVRVNETEILARAERAQRSEWKITKYKPKKTHIFGLSVCTENEQNE